MQSMIRKNNKISRLAAPVAAILMLCANPFCSGAEARTSMQSSATVMYEPDSLKVAGQNVADAAEKSAEAKVQSIELLSTSQSWDGAHLPAYPKGKPLVKILKVILPPHAVLPQHHHDIMSYGYIIKGELTLVRASDGKEVTLHAGDAVAETVKTVHYGENRGNEPTELIVFYPTKEGQSLSEPD